MSAEHQATSPPAPQQQPAKLWLWKNGPMEFWAFDNPYPIHMDNGDPQTLGEPVGYALFKPSRNGRPDRSDKQVLVAIERAAPPAPPAGPTQCKTCKGVLPVGDFMDRCGAGMTTMCNCHAPPAGAGQQPTGWRMRYTQREPNVAHGDWLFTDDAVLAADMAKREGWTVEAMVLASPSAAPAVQQTELTDEQIRALWNQHGGFYPSTNQAFARAIEREVRSMLSGAPAGQAVPATRMLTDPEMEQAWKPWSVWGRKETVEACIRKFCEVNGIQLQAAPDVHQDFLGGSARQESDSVHSALSTSSVPTAAPRSSPPESDRSELPRGTERECGNPDCGWSGTTDRYCGSVGPLCPDCGEVTE